MELVSWLVIQRLDLAFCNPNRTRNLRKQSPFCIDSQIIEELMLSTNFENINISYKLNQI